MTGKSVNVPRHGNTGRRVREEHGLPMRAADDSAPILRAAVQQPEQRKTIGLRTPPGRAVRRQQLPSGP